MMPRVTQRDLSKKTADLEDEPPSLQTQAMLARRLEEIMCPLFIGLEDCLIISVLVEFSIDNDGGMKSSLDFNMHLPSTGPI